MLPLQPLVTMRTWARVLEYCATQRTKRHNTHENFDNKDATSPGKETKEDNFKKHQKNYTVMALIMFFSFCLVASVF